MEAITRLEQIGFRFFIVGEKLKYEYAGEGLPDDSAASLFAEVKANREQVIAYLRGRTMPADQAIRLAWQGELKNSVLIKPKPEYRDLWGGAVWLCPDISSKEKIKQKYPDSFVLSAKEFFDICQLVKNGGGEQLKVRLMLCDYSVARWRGWKTMEKVLEAVIYGVFLAVVSCLVADCALLAVRWLSKINFKRFL